MKIAVIGNCQAVALAKHLTALSPGLSVTVHAQERSTTEDDLERWRSALSSHDVIFSQQLGRQWGPLATARLLDESPALNLNLYPSFHFTGFHPDAMHVSPRMGIRTPFGSWQSGIIMAASLLKVPERQVAALFNAYVYRVLGYFEEYERSVAFHTLEAEKLGYTLDINSWSEHGPFATLPHHPTPVVFRDLARQMCAKASIEIDQGALEPEDVLADTVSWPVYPELARNLGVSGDLIFYGRTSRGQPLVGLSLDETIAVSYRGFRPVRDVMRTLKPVRNIMLKLSAEGVGLNARRESKL